MYFNKWVPFHECMCLCLHRCQYIYTFMSVSIYSIQYMFICISLCINMYMWMYAYFIFFYLLLVICFLRSTTWWVLLDLHTSTLTCNHSYYGNSHCSCVYGDRVCWGSRGQGSTETGETVFKYEQQKNFFFFAEDENVVFHNIPLDVSISLLRHLDLTQLNKIWLITVNPD